jgi:hypothetical protein
VHQDRIDKKTQKVGTKSLSLLLLLLSDGKLGGARGNQRVDTFCILMGGIKTPQIPDYIGLPCDGYYVTLKCKVVALLLLQATAEFYLIL